MWLRLSDNNKCSTKEGNVNNTCAVVWYDINGPDKPNTYGKDVFIFLVLRNSIETCKNNCSKNGEGSGCSNYIIKNENMNYLH